MQGEPTQAKSLILLTSAFITSWAIASTLRSAVSMSSFLACAMKLLVCSCIVILGSVTGVLESVITLCTASFPERHENLTGWIMTRRLRFGLG